MDAPTLPVLSLQQLMHIDHDIKKSSSEKTGQNHEEEDDILLDLTNLNITDINLELRQLREDLTFDYQTIMQHLKNNRLLLQRKSYSEKLSHLNDEIQQLKLLKENWEKDKQQQKQELLDRISEKELELQQLNDSIDELKRAKLSPPLLDEMEKAKDELSGKESQLISVQKEIVSLDIELQQLNPSASLKAHDFAALTLQDRIMLDVLRVEMNNNHTGCFIGETDFVELPRGEGNRIMFTDEAKEKMWEALKKSCQPLNII